MTPTPNAPAKPPKRRWWLWGLVLFFFVGLPAVGVIGIAVAMSGERVPDHGVLKLKLSGEVPERASTSGLQALLGDLPLSLKDHLSNLHKAAVDKRVQGVVLVLDGPALGWSQLEELQEALDALRAKGKWVLSYAEGHGEKGYSLALSADEVLMGPDGFFEFNGLATDVLHLPGLLEKAGIQVQYYAYGKYKSVSGQTYGRRDLTEPVKEMINDLLDDQYERFVQRVATARKLTVAEVKALIDAPGLRAEWALEHKLIDGLAYWDEVEANVRKRTGLKADEKITWISPKAYRRTSPEEAGLKQGKDTIALVSAVGLIVSGKGGTDPFSGGDSQGSAPVIEALRRAEKDDEVKAIVFRVDSPGGAGLGCDLVRREVERIKAKKPIFVSMGDYAASGGYWVSMAATAIIANPSTHTGSIGIWSVVPNFKGTYEKAGMEYEVFKRGAHADMLGADRPFDAAEAKLYDDNLLASYRRFVELAAKGRGKTVEQLELVAQGRSWSGEEALKNGLIDGIGSLTFTIDYAAKKVGLSGREAVKVRDFDKQENVLEKLLAPDKEDDEARAQGAAVLAALLEASGFQPLARRLFPITAVAREVLAGQTLFPMVEYRVDVR